MKIIGLILTFILFVSCTQQSAMKTNESGQNVRANRPPAIVYNPAPEYPQDALEQEIERKVIVSITLNKEGNVVEAVIDHSDNKIFENAALEAAKKCRFKPGIRDGKPVIVKMKIPYNFDLD